MVGLLLWVLTCGLVFDGLGFVVLSVDLGCLGLRGCFVGLFCLRFACLRVGFWDLVDVAGLILFGVELRIACLGFSLVGRVC